MGESLRCPSSFSSTPSILRPRWKDMSEAKAMVDAIKTAVRYSRLSESHSGSFSRQCSIGRAALREEEISSRSADTGARIQSVGKREGGRREERGHHP